MIAFRFGWPRRFRAGWNGCDCTIAICGPRRRSAISTRAPKAQSETPASCELEKLGAQGELT